MSRIFYIDYNETTTKEDPEMLKHIAKMIKREANIEVVEIDPATVVLEALCAYRDNLVRQMDPNSPTMLAKYQIVMNEIAAVCTKIQS